MVYNLKANDQRARLAIVFLFIQIILTVANELSNFLELSLYKDIRAGLEISEDRVDLLEGFQAIYGLFFLVVFIATIVLFIMWFRRAYYNLGQIVRIENSDGWAAGAWFIPFYNLVKPKKIMDELYYKTNRILSFHQPNYVKRSTEIVTIWWITWIVANILSNISTRMYLRADAVGDYIQSLQIGLFTEVLTIVPAILAILVIKRYAVMEELLINLNVKPEVDLNSTAPISTATV